MIPTDKKLQLGWSEAELTARRKGDPRKVKLARELRSTTTMPLGWIAQRLRMGSRGYLAWLLAATGKRPARRPDKSTA